MIHTPLEPLIKAAGLSERQSEVVRLLAADMVIGDIAIELKITPQSVRTHQQRAWEKMELVKRLLDKMADDEAEMADPHRQAGFIIGCVKGPPNHAPGTPVFRNVVEEAVFSETQMEQGRMMKLGVVRYADKASIRGQMVTPEDVVNAPARRPIGPNAYGLDTDDIGPYEPGAVANRSTLARKGED
jgi:DNA-binding CsgD family transcriptional regulator